MKSISPKKAEKKEEEKEGEKELTAKEKLEKDLGDIETAYQNAPYRTYSGIKVANVKPRVYEYPTDERLAEKAKETAEATARAEKDKETEKAVEKYLSYADKANSAEKSAEKEVAEIAAAYEKARRLAENKALSKGTGRSSIIQSRLVGLNAAEEDRAGKVKSEKDEKINKIDAETAKLAAEVAAKIEKIDGATEENIKKALKALKNEREKEKEETDEYNAKAEARKKSAEEELARRRISAEEKNSDEYAEMLYGKIKALYEYYYSLGKDAKKEIDADKDFIISNVGDNGYAYLRRFFV